MQIVTWDVFCKKKTDNNFSIQVPLSSTSPLTGRQWFFREILENLSSCFPPCTGVVVTGKPGSGKTAIILSMVEQSCFGTGTFNPHTSPLPPPARQTEVHHVSQDHLAAVAKTVVAYHFCQVWNKWSSENTFYQHLGWQCNYVPGSWICPLHCCPNIPGGFVNLQTFKVLSLFLLGSTAVFLFSILTVRPQVQGSRMLLIL